MTTILHPLQLTITDDESSKAYFGGDQEWYSEEWQRMAGCGPTCAANVTSYLAFTRPSLRALYIGDDMRQRSFTAHMQALYTHVTPGSMGLNRPEMFAQGVVAFAESRGLRLIPHLFEAHGYQQRNRPPVEEMAAFVQQGLERDCPVAFLNLTKGRVKNIQGWHWITIIGAEDGANSLTAVASDEGKQISFDLRLWYLSTRMRGGLVYFTEL
jgi:hypothetical protein